MKGNGTAVLTKTTEAFSLEEAPPTGVFTANIQDYQNNPLGVTIFSAFLKTNGIAGFGMSFFASPGPQQDAPIFVEPVTLLPVGYALYASNVIAQAEHFVTKPNQTIIGVFLPPTITEGWNPGDSWIDFEFESIDESIPDHKLWYDEGDICRLEVWAVGKQGPIIRVGEKIVTVLAA